MRTTKPNASHFVSLARRASSDFALFLAKNVSAAPAMAPERPALLPDWKIIMTTRATPAISWIMVKASFIKTNIPFGGLAASALL